jgi:hypothetical protein
MQCWSIGWEKPEIAGAYVVLQQKPYPTLAWCLQNPLNNLGVIPGKLDDS